MVLFGKDMVMISDGFMNSEDVMVNFVNFNCQVRIYLDKVFHWKEMKTGQIKDELTSYK